MHNAIFLGDAEYLSEHLSEDVDLEIFGRVSTRGQNEVMVVLDTLKAIRTEDFNMDDLITHGLHAAMNGIYVTLAENGTANTFAYSMFLKLNKFKNGKINRIKLYIVPLSE
ncbi:MAG: hypothetical protein WBI17_01585 [Clostridiaceae bacterium]